MSFLSALDTAALSDIGLKRQRNEDASGIFIPPPDVDQEPLGALFMVADGMGGLGGGDVASRYALNETVRAYYDVSTGEGDLPRRLQHALQSASNVVSAQAPKIGLPRIGATAAGIILTTAGDALIFNVGDCRVYRVRGSQIERLSHDQSVMERRIEDGISPERAAQETGSAMVTAYLGQPRPVKPECRVDRALADDIYVICSDGLWTLLTPEEILKLTRREPSDRAAQKLIRLALKRGAPDNVTVVVVRLGKA